MNKLGSETQGRTQKFQGSRRREFKCYNCGEAGHMARDWKKPRRMSRNIPLAESVLEGSPPDRSNPSIGSVTQ